MGLSSKSSKSKDFAILSRVRIPNYRQINKLVPSNPFWWINLQGQLQPKKRLSGRALDEAHIWQVRSEARLYKFKMVVAAIFRLRISTDSADVKSAATRVWFFLYALSGQSGGPLTRFCRLQKAATGGGAFGIPLQIRCFAALSMTGTLRSKPCQGSLRFLRLAPSCATHVRRRACVGRASHLGAQPLTRLPFARSGNRGRGVWDTIANQMLRCAQHDLRFPLRSLRLRSCNPHKTTMGSRSCPLFVTSAVGRVLLLVTVSRTYMAFIISAQITLKLRRCIGGDLCATEQVGTADKVVRSRNCVCHC
jgi:hypothetical protein